MCIYTYRYHVHVIVAIGKVYQSVIAQERKGEYLGKTVQIIPHITNEIMHRIEEVAHKPVG